MTAVKRAIVAGVMLALWAPAAHAGPPLIPRELASLLDYADTLVEVDSRAEPMLQAAGAEAVAPTLGIWSLPSSVAMKLIPRLAVSGALTEFSPDRPLWPADHVAAGDHLFASQWWYASVGADRVEPPGPGVPVLVIDSGLDSSHPEFAARPDTELLTSQTIEGPNEFHGTAVASVIAAPANGVGLLGVYPQVALKIWDVSPGGALSTRQLVAGLEAAPDRSVVNLSLGSPFRDLLIEHAVLNAFDRGLIIVAASGNSGLGRNRTSFPAAMPHVLTVGSTGRGDTDSGFSTRSQSVDVAAPGEEIPVAVPLAFDPSGYRLESGTSFSAPIVAGAVAWIWTVRPELDKTQVMELIRRTARDVGAPGRDESTGFGVLDIPAALTAPAPAVDPLEPNDDVDNVVSGNLFARSKAPLTRPGKGRATLRARLDVWEDPRDVYRVWVPPGRRVTVTVRSAQDIDLEIWSGEAEAVSGQDADRALHLLSRSTQRGVLPETASVRNRSDRGRFVFVNVLPRAVEADYSLSVTTARPPR